MTMAATNRTVEQQQALSFIQNELKPHVGALLDGYAAMLADVPADFLDLEVNNLGHILLLALQGTAPHLSEATQYGMAFAFTEMLRTRVTSNNPQRKVTDNDQSS